ncbi:MAG TPA: serine hydrolase [Bradyrhizobium sp.]|nr:serine hydrolase [Bradyrhizobium sp.]
MGAAVLGAGRAFTALSAIILTASIGCGAASAQGVAAQTIWPTGAWQTSTPEEQGVDSAELAKLLDFGKTKNFDSLLLVRHGRIVLDAYYAPYTADIPHAINSSTKAVIGTLTAIAIKEGLLDSRDHRMLDFFGERAIANLDDRKKAITVQNLLDMTSGFEWEEGFEGGREQSLVDWDRSPNQVNFVLDRPMAHTPGEVFYYNSGNPHLMSAILTKLTGMTARDYAVAKLFGPLGIAPPFWRHDAQGLSTGGGGLSLHPRDMAKIGYLYLHDGEWEDKQLLPSGWVDSVSHATVDMHASFNPDLRYSNFFWVMPNRHVYMSVGYHCQVVMVFPDRDMVAVMTARAFCPFGKMADMISAAVKSEAALAPNPAGAALLADAIRDISTEKPGAVGATPDIASAISGKNYQFSGNALNVKSLSLDLTAPNPHYDLEIFRPPLRFSGPIGLDGRYRKGEPTPLGVSAVRGTWSNANTFEIDFQYLGSGEQRKWTLSFDGERSTLRGNAKDGREVAVDGAAGG